MVQLPPDAPSPRLCLLVKTRADQEYGYNLHAEKGKGQFVGIVDKGSVADVGGLRTGDRIFAINGQSIIGDSHKKVVEKIKSQSMKCEMLVTTEEEAKWYAEHDIQITLQLPNIIKMSEETNHRDSHSNGSPPPAAGWYAPNTNKSTDPVFVAPPPPLDDMEQPLPLICVLEKSSPSDEFGFNLHAEKGKGHFIGTVDQGGIGDKSGLRLGQRIVGVNGTLVYPNTPHKDVVALIKKSPLSTTLLVASEEVDTWHKTHQTPFSFDKARHAKEHEQPLSPHSIQISDEEEIIEATPSPAPRAHEEAVKVEAAPPLPSAPVHYEEPPMVQYDLVPDEDLLNAVFSALPPAEASSIGAGAVVAAVEQEHLVEHDGHQAPPLVASEQHEEEHHDTYNPYAPASPPPSEIYHHENHYNEAPQHNHHDHHHETHHEVPVSNGYSSQTSEASEPFDIFGLSAKEARERLRQQKKRATDMSLEEKYRLVTNM